MEKWIDLHTHTTASDGSMTPRELVRHAKEMGLSAIAVTDHDSVEGIREALDEGDKVGLEVIPGLEISAEYKPEMHILGYFPRNGYERIRVILDGLKKSRDERNPKIIRRLNELGMEITLEEAEKAATSNIVGRPHIAKVLMKKGYVKSISEAFEKYLSSGKPAYFRKERLTPVDGIHEITKAGGMAVLAHPIYLGLTMDQLDEQLGILAAAGLKGIEAHYVDNSAEETGIHLRLAIKHHLLATGGSDFHGRMKPDIEIGEGRGNLRIPYELLEKMKAAGLGK